MDRSSYFRDYQAQNIVQKKVIFNRKSEEDITLLDWVELQANFNTYCKDLIRADMRERCPDFPEGYL